MRELAGHAIDFSMFLSERDFGLMNYFTRKPWHLPQRLHTPEDVFFAKKYHRRQFLAAMGMGAVGIGLSSGLVGCSEATDEEVLQSGKVDVPSAVAERSSNPDEKNASPGESTGNTFGAERNPDFEYGRPETPEEAAARYTNFYEFSGGKDNFRRVDAFQPHPWKFEVAGLCAKPRVFDIDDVYKTMALEERQYRFRCVETWAMCVPWTGFKLADLLKLVEPSPQAKFVEFQTFDMPRKENENSELPTFLGPNMSSTFSSYPWPYTEGLTMAEATNELTLLAVGIYGKPLAKQHGAPIRLVVPWKYGFKNCKSIVRITLTDKQPATFWNTLSPQEYGFKANVNPAVPHPRWSQAKDRMLGTGDEFPTELYNGYGDYVAELYPT